MIGGSELCLNDEKEIRMNFYTFGFQSIVNRDWEIMAEVPLM
jgi:hypothetical protein